MKLSRLGFLTGFVIALVIYPLLNLLAPPRGLGEGEDHHDEDTFVLPSAFDQSRPTQGRYAVLDGVEEASDDSRQVGDGGLGLGVGSVEEDKRDFAREKRVAVAL